MQFWTFKRGATFAPSVEITDNGVAVTGITSQLQAQIRGESDVLIKELQISESSTPGTYILDAGDTSGWPVTGRPLFMDVKYVNPEGRIILTETIRINLIRQVTHS